VLRISVSEDDVARIDEVLARPEFAEWSRIEWCREIIRTALRYYAGNPAAPEARPVTTPSSAPSAPAPAPEPPLPEADEAAPEPPEPPARPDCLHPPDARDYQTGTCAACGAILWD
jgi:hypothetical protein